MSACRCGHMHRDHAIEHSTDEPCVVCKCRKYMPIRFFGGKKLETKAWWRP